MQYQYKMLLYYCYLYANYCSFLKSNVYLYAIYCCSVQSLLAKVQMFKVKLNTNWIFFFSF